MDAKVRKHLYWFIACLVIIALCAIMANVFEHGFWPGRHQEGQDRRRRGQHARRQALHPQVGFG